MKEFMDNQTVKLLQGDCLDLMKTIPDGSVDLVLTDSPYIDYPKILWYNAINTLKGEIC